MIRTGRWFWAWVLLGCLAALGFVSLGVLVIAPVLVLGLLLASRPDARASAYGLLTGVGLLLVFVAWLHRDGPGTTCWQRGTSSGCDEHLNPLPWLVAGVLLFSVGLIGEARRRR